MYARRVEDLNLDFIKLNPSNINKDNGIENPEARMPLRSRNTKTGEQYDSGSPREQLTEAERIKMHHSKLFKNSQSQRSIVLSR